MVIYLALMAEAFLGYVLPWGNMSYWGAQVIVSLAGAIPVVGPDLMEWVRGRNDLRLLGPSDPAHRAPTIALVHDRPGEELAQALIPHGIMAGGGASSLGSTGT